MTKQIAIGIGVVAVLAICGVTYRYLSQAPTQSLPPSVTATTSTPTPAPAPTATTPTSTATTDAHPGMKLYKNDSFGFEFWYPANWEWQENVFGSPFSRFNLTVMKIDGINTNQDDIINVVTPDFAVREYQGLNDKATPFTVDGVKGLKYVYQEDANYMDVVIPVNKDITIIFGNEDPAHIAEFNEIISSFKFLK